MDDNLDMNPTVRDFQMDLPVSLFAKVILGKYIICGWDIIIVRAQRGGRKLRHGASLFVCRVFSIL
jgi:hypothetical protein